MVIEATSYCAVKLIRRCQLLWDSRFLVLVFKIFKNAEHAEKKLKSMWPLQFLSLFLEKATMIESLLVIEFIG